MRDRDDESARNGDSESEESPSTAMQIQRGKVTFNSVSVLLWQMVRYRATLISINVTALHPFVGTGSCMSTNRSLGYFVIVIVHE
jgi:hypothetical protein